MTTQSKIYFAHVLFLETMMVQMQSNAKLIVCAPLLPKSKYIQIPKKITQIEMGFPESDLLRLN